MKKRSAQYLVILAAILHGTPTFAQTSSNVEVVATGLDNPRGLKFHGNVLYVAEAGVGGSDSTAGVCEQAPPPLGPITGGLTGRVSLITPQGHRQTIIDNLPSSRTRFNDILGATDIDFVNSKMYILISAGCAKGNAEFPNAVARREGNGAEVVADLSHYIRTNPQDFVPDDDEDPEGNPFSFKATASGDIIVVEANRSTIDRVATDGSIRRVADLARATQRYDTPVAIDIDRDGNIYIGSFGEFPYPAGTSKIYQIKPSGEVSEFASGFSTLIDVAFDSQGTLHVLETSTGNTGQPPFLNRNTGRVTRIVNGSTEVVATGLDMPSAMTFGPDGYLYVSNRGHGMRGASGQGQIVRIDVTP